MISISGSLPLGNLNITALLIASKESWRKALWFAVGVTIVEVLYLRITLGALDLILSKRSVFFALQWVTVLVLLAFATASFIALRKGASPARNVLIENKLNRFVLGTSMSALNPMQFPFWAAWGIYAITQNWLMHINESYNIFTIGAGLGTMTGLLIFIALGRKLAPVLQKYQRVMQLLTGCLFLCLAIFQIIKIWSG